jgi:hypothetical protein
MATTPPMLAVSYLGARGISTAVVGEAASRKNSDDSNIVVASISTSPGCSSPEEESSRRNCWLLLSQSVLVDQPGFLSLRLDCLPSALFPLELNIELVLELRARERLAVAGLGRHLSSSAERILVPELRRRLLDHFCIILLCPCVRVVGGGSQSRRRPLQHVSERPQDGRYLRAPRRELALLLVVV